VPICTRSRPPHYSRARRTRRANSPLRPGSNRLGLNEARAPGLRLADSPPPPPPENVNVLLEHKPGCGKTQGWFEVHISLRANIVPGQETCARHLSLRAGEKVGLAAATAWR